MTVAEIDALLYLPGHPREPARARHCDPRPESRVAGVVRALLDQRRRRRRAPATRV